MHDGTRWYRTVQDGARLYRIVKDSMGMYRIAQDYTGPCGIVRASRGLECVQDCTGSVQARSCCIVEALRPVPPTRFCACQRTEI